MDTEYEPLLPGIAFAGYRSFAEWQEIRLPTKVTVLAGINNSGKSNVLRFIQEILPQTRDSRGQRQGQLIAPTLTDLDTPRGFFTVPTFELGFPTLSSESTEAANQIARRALDSDRLGDLQAAVIDILAGGQDVFWVRYAAGSGRTLAPSPSLVEQAMESWPAWNSDFQQALHTLGGGTVEARSVMTALLASIPRPTIPPVATIAGSRRVESGIDETTDADWSSGRGIIGELFKLQNPSHENWDQADASWRAINRFIQTVLGDPDARLTIPHDRSTVQVATKTRVLPLSSLGSGVEQVIILAGAATIVSKHLVCVEEPETNLHPLLQKKLLRFLTEETDNQYIIATHSSHFLDDSHTTAYNVRLTEKGTMLSLARRPDELVQICNDLGYHPSDLQQANCVVWVEGPSDRIYVRRWLELIDDSLAEGIHYSIMFYGGRLLSHLSTSVEALDDFISLRRLNRSSTVLIDSDKANPDAPIGATKLRIRDEYAEGSSSPGSAWITAGFTIENYIPGDVLEEAVRKAQPTVQFTPVDEWTNPLPKRNGTQFDKIAIARVAAEILQDQHLDTLDLRAKVQDLRSFIKAANGHSTAPDPDR